jgi:putative ABC transport system permease protein
MKSILQIAVRNLFRYKRRTYLTTGIVLFGVALVIVFSGFANSMKKNMIGGITGGLLGDMQIHGSGYVASIENLPLYLSINENNYRKLKDLLDQNSKIEAFTPRIKFSGMVSNFVKTSGLRFIAVDPVSEIKVCTNLPVRVTPTPDSGKGLLQKGEIVMPSLIANGLSIKTGDEIVILANNKEGSINAITLKVAGMSGSITDPSGRDAYIHIDDARTLLRIESTEISEVALRLKNFDELEEVQKNLSQALSGILDENSKPIFESHTWQELSPVATFISVLNILLFISKLILIVIVLISVMNVMIMSVYERVSEIGTIAAIGTVPSKILFIFLSEGILLGFFGAILGIITGLIINFIIGLMKIEITLGHMMKLKIQPYLYAGDIISACVIVIIIAGLASLEPALKASKLEPVDAMRHN